MPSCWNLPAQIVLVHLSLEKILYSSFGFLHTSLCRYSSNPIQWIDYIFIFIFYKSQIYAENLLIICTYGKFCVLWGLQELNSGHPAPGQDDQPLLGFWLIFEFMRWRKNTQNISVLLFTFAYLSNFSRFFSVQRFSLHDEFTDLCVYACPPPDILHSCKLSRLSLLPSNHKVFREKRGDAFMNNKHWAVITDIWHPLNCNFHQHTQAKYEKKKLEQTLFKILHLVTGNAFDENDADFLWVWIIRRR